MKKILILGTNRGSVEIVKQSNKRGLYTIVTDQYQPERSEAKKYANEYWNIRTDDYPALYNKCLQENVSAVICGASDSKVNDCLIISKMLNLPMYCTASSWAYSRDKRLFKNACKKNGVPVPKDFWFGGEINEANIEYPVVVKPVDMAGNYGVSYCNNRSELLAGIEHATETSKSGNIVVEKMVDGKEWSAFYAIAQGKAVLVAISELYSQPGYPKNCYSVTTTAASHIKRYIDEINDSVVSLLEDIGCTDGICWVQFMCDADERFYAIEMGHRLGGNMMFVPYNNIRGFDSVNWLIDCSLGISHSQHELPNGIKSSFEQCGCGYMFWTKRGGTIASIEGLEKLSMLQDAVLDMRYHVGDTVIPYTSCGTITFSCENVELMCKRIKTIASTIRILDEEANDMLIQFDDFESIKDEYYNERLNRG